MGDTDAADGPTLVERAHKLAPLIGEHADQAERDRHLSETVAGELAAAGLHQLGLPVSYGGADIAPRFQVEAIEAVARVDGATGWNLMIGVENKALMAMQWRAGAQLVAAPTTIMCGSTAVVGRADAVAGGWKVSGQWSWVSGCHNAHWFGGLVHAFRDGAQVTERPVYAFVERPHFEILDTWHTAGMRGSGSHDVVANDLVVPDEHMAFYDKAWIRDQRRESAVARIPLGVRLAHNKTGVALGIGRAGLDAFRDLATEKEPAFASGKLATRPFAQRSYAAAEARLRSSRAWVLEQCDEAWDAAQADRPLTDHQKAMFLLACSDATAGCVEAIEMVVEAAGTTANVDGHPLDRIRRNATVVRSHVTVAPHLRDEAGARLLGHGSPSFLFDLP